MFKSSIGIGKSKLAVAAFARMRRVLPRILANAATGMEIAIAEWEADLDWLRVTYYDGRYQFDWPSTEVW